MIADEIHGDLALPPFRFTPFGSTSDSGVSWAAIHGPIKTFGLAGVCDTLLVTGDEHLTELFRSRSSQLHLTRNNIFGIAAFEAAYGAGGSWLDNLLDLVAANIALLQDRLPNGIELIAPEGTYLAWLDFRQLDMDVPELARWLASSSRLTFEPGTLVRTRGCRLCPHDNRCAHRTGPRSDQSTHPSRRRDPRLNPRNCLGPPDCIRHPPDHRIPGMNAHPTQRPYRHLWVVRPTIHIAGCGRVTIRLGSLRVGGSDQRQGVHIRRRVSHPFRPPCLPRSKRYRRAIRQRGPCRQTPRVPGSFRW